MKTIYFAHANGFPAQTYQQFFSHLNDDYQISYLSQFGHDPKYPVNNNWQNLVQQLIDDVKQRCQLPVIGVGHSLGGGLIYLAAHLQPDLFQSIVLLDYPLFGRLKSWIIALSKWSGLIDHLMPGQITLRRRTQWPNELSAYEYLRDKKLFSHFDQKSLWDYIHFGMEKTSQGLSLKFSSQIEYQIFHYFPHHLPKFNKSLSCPSAFIYGQQSPLIKKFDRKIIENFYKIPLFATQGSHLFPFEYPRATAETLKQVLKTIAI